MRTLLVSFVVVLTTIALHTSPAMADCNCVAVAAALEAKIDGKIRAEVARADSLYARGDYQAAFAIYERARVETNATVLLYAQGMTEWQLGMASEARAHLAAYVDASGDVDAVLRARASAAVEAIDGGVTTAVGDLRDDVGGVVGGVVGVGAGAAGAGAGVVGGVAGEVRGTVAKPKKVAKGAAIVLGIVAVAAVVAISAEGISARKPEVDFNKKYGVGLGIGAAVAGGSAIYLWGLTAATGAAGGVGCGVAGTF